jgi:phosphoribosylamine--glycine ligase
VRILVVGGGGREHALTWSLTRSGHSVTCCPGNPGIARVAETAPASATDADRLVAIAIDRGVELAVIGPEAPLVEGLADRLRAAGVPTFGPSAAGARLEGSKVFAKEFFARHRIRTAQFAACASMAEAERAIADLGGRVVVKADGLAAGKGVAVCANAGEAAEAAREMLSGRFGPAGQRLVIEERLGGRELSVMAITDGIRCELLAPAEDHKAIFDGDRGPNTGGMGTVSPAAWVTRELIDRTRREIFEPTLAGLAADGIDYRGVLYAGLMVDDAGVPWMLEYNCRFGDPETQPVVARLASDLGEWLAGAAAGRLPSGSMTWDPRAAVCVVLASAGYPETADRGRAITGLERAEADRDVAVFHAGTAIEAGALVTAGGRVLGVTALGEGVEAARERAYAAVAAIHFEGVQYRRDIGRRWG